jgi:thiol:disulfide interchange protein DsbD
MSLKSLLSAVAAALLACALLLGPPRALADDFLPIREAFKYTTALQESRLAVTYEIAPGYYLYQKRLGFESGTAGVSLGSPTFPDGQEHEDEYFGRQVIYRDRVTVPIDVAFDGQPRPFDLRLKFQGCADAGLCYPPTTWTTRIEVSGGAARSAEASTGGAVDVKQMLAAPNDGTSGEFLKPDQAFAFSAASPHADRVTLEWQIAPGYYLYRDRISVKLPSGIAQLGEPRFPEGETHEDEYFGEQVVYRDAVAIEVPIARSASVSDLPIEVTYQGCADAGLCYQPIRKQISVSLAPMSAAAAADPGDGGPSAVTPVRSEQDTLADRIRTGNVATMLAFFFVIGLGLAFTPCVLPMVPIVSGIIVGASRGTPVTRGRAFLLSLVYVLGMAFTYTLAGVAFAAAGRQAQAYFQEPWMIVGFAALFVVLALSMFGLFTLQVPAVLQSRIAALSDRQRQGTLFGTAIIGALSALIVTACVAPALVASLAVIGEGGNIVRGGLALFAMSIGMGVPLLAVGASAGALLPRAGAWMDVVKAAFGVMLLGVAIWMLSRILPGPVTLALWAALAFVTGYCLLTLGGREARSGFDSVRRGLGALVTVYGVLMLIGALAGRSDPLQPLAGMGAAGASDTAHESVGFQRVKSVADLERAVAEASAAGRPVMLDFYADWCVSCKEMEKYTFPEAGVRAELERATLLQADVTANDEVDQALLSHFGILGPPTIVFFDRTGREQPEYRIVGFKPADEFRAHLARVFGAAT